ncbi:MAG: transposase [Pseudomonadota bacterium]
MDKDCPNQSALRKFRYSACNQTYLITTVTYQRMPIFTDFWAGRILVNELRRLEDQGSAETLAWVVMPDHLHWLMQLKTGSSLSNVLKALKGRSSRKLNIHLRRKGAAWQPAYHDHAVRKEEDLVELARYVVANPLRAGLVRTVRDYPLWDCVWL